MPIGEPDLQGTEADGSKSQKYCVYCYKDGEFTQPDATLEGMIEISARGWADQDPSVTYEQAKSQLEKVVPYLERWRK
jgi:hypothetical protein